MKTRHPSKMWVWIALPLVVLGVYLGLRWFEQAQVFQPVRAWAMDPADLPWKVQDISFPAADGVLLSGWWMSPLESNEWSGWVALISHGNGGNLSHRSELYELWLSLGFRVFAYDYRGYGRSEGRPSEAGVYSDAEGAYRWVLGQAQGAQVLALGESLGGGVATELARHETVGGLILQSSFTSVPDIGREWFPWLPVGLVGRIKFDTRSKLGEVHAPVLILHSPEDRLISFSHAERNFAAAHSPKMLWRLAGDHNDPLGWTRDRYLAGVHRWIAGLKSREQRS